MGIGHKNFFYYHIHSEEKAVCTKKKASETHSIGSEWIFFGWKFISVRTKEKISGNPIREIPAEAWLEENMLETQKRTNSPNESEEWAKKLSIVVSRKLFLGFFYLILKGSLCKLCTNSTTEWEVQYYVRWADFFTSEQSTERLLPLTALRCILSLRKGHF